MTKLSLSDPPLDRTTPPTFNKDFTFSLIDAERYEITTGMPVYVLSGGDQEIIKLELVFNTGRWAETKPGLSYFTAHSLLKGTASKSSFEIATAFDKLGAHLDVEPGADYVSVTLHVLSSKFEAATRLLLDMLVGAQFPDKELYQLKTNYLQTLAVNNEKTSFVASKLFRKALFGDTHPYGREVRAEDVEQLHRDDLVRYHRDSFRGFAAFASGKVGIADRELLSSQLPGLGFVSAGSPPADPKTAAGRLIEARASSLQTSIRMGKRVVSRAHPDYPYLLLLNHVLGGFFGSRLMKSIREEKGWTYGIHSSVHALKNDAYLAIGSDVIKSSRDAAFEEIAKELNELRNRPIPENELDTARYHFLGTLSAELSTVFSHAEKTKTKVLNSLPEDYYTILFNKIEKATPERLLSVAQRFLSDEEWVEVAVG